MRISESLIASLPTSTLLSTIRHPQSMEVLKSFLSPAIFRRRLEHSTEKILPSGPKGAVIEALSLPELLNSIFSHLPPETILSFQRVCKKWHLVISSLDPDLQIRLFLKPAPADSTLFPRSKPTFNPILSSKSENWLKDRRTLSALNLISEAYPESVVKPTRSRAAHLLPWYRDSV